MGTLGCVCRSIELFLSMELNTINLVDVLEDLKVAEYFEPKLISEIEGIEKPDAAMFNLACQRAGVSTSSAAHVGDELKW